MKIFFKKTAFFAVLIFVVIFISTSVIIITNTILHPSQSSSAPAGSEQTSVKIPEIPVNQSIKSAYFAQLQSESVPDSLNLTCESEFDKYTFGKVGFKDEQYYKTSSPSLPVQRYEIIPDTTSPNSEKIGISWEGKSNRLLHLYAWNPNTLKWTQLKSLTGRNSKNIEIRAEINKTEFLSNGSVSILVSAAPKNAMQAARIPSAGEYDFTFAWFTDTQYYSSTYPAIFDSITSYISANQKEKKFIYGIHTGDIVDDMLTASQWRNADLSLGILDKAKFPYGVLAGNHDVAFDKQDYSNYYKYFGESRYNKLPTYGGTPNNNKDHYDLVSSNGMNFVVIYLGWRADKNSIEWANGVLKKYADRKAIIAHHAYSDGRGTYREQGQEISEKIVKPNENVFMVLSGHYFGNYSTIKSYGGRYVHEFFFNNQNGEKGGSGYFRLLHFDAVNNLLHVNTYSPYLGKYNVFEPMIDQFVTSIGSDSEEPFISTDYIKAETAGK